MFLLALAVFISVQTLQLDFTRLNNWFFTDYEPYGSPMRFRDNPLFLFIATDTLWAAFFAFRATQTRRWKYALILPLIPLAIVGVKTASYKSLGRKLRTGFPRRQKLAVTRSR